MSCILFNILTKYIINGIKSEVKWRGFLEFYVSSCAKKFYVYCTINHTLWNIVLRSYEKMLKKSKCSRDDRKYKVKVYNTLE